MHSISTEKAPAAIGPYSQGVVVTGLLFPFVRIALTPETRELVGSSIEGQAEQVMKNVGALLTAAGTDFDHVVKTTCFLEDIADFAKFNAVYAKSFGEKLPARSAVGIDKLPKGALIEVEVIASVED